MLADITFIGGWAGNGEDRARDRYRAGLPFLRSHHYPFRGRFRSQVASEFESELAEFSLSVCSSPPCGARGAICDDPSTGCGSLAMVRDPTSSQRV